MIDFINLPNYKFSDQELEEFLIFSICVANKSAKTIAPRVHEFCKSKKPCVFESIKSISEKALQKELQSLGIGCFNLKAKCLKFLSKKNLDLRKCTAEELQEAPGIGNKTSRFFLGHSRPGFKGAILDTHILKFIREMGHDAPLTTPKSLNKYQELEDIFVNHAYNLGLTTPELDIIVWKHYAVEKLSESEWKKLFTRAQAS